MGPSSMSEGLPAMQFYLPERRWPRTLPTTSSDYWDWHNETGGLFRNGRYNWTLLTYLYLREAGLVCNLTPSLPDEGIVVVHRKSLSSRVKPKRSVLLVCMQGDCTRHPYAQLHIVQNPDDVAFPDNVGSPSERAPDSYYFPLWPQPGLLPRDPDRGDRFENAAYFGRQQHQAPELLSSEWTDRLRGAGLSWAIVRPEQWNDYRQADVVVAVRSFKHRGAYRRKPPSKLINAWHAGVPAVLGNESAYRALRRSELDYIEVTSPAEAGSALDRLRKDASLRRAMAENGRVRAKETEPSALALQWKAFLSDVAVKRYEEWRSSSWQRRATFIASRSIHGTVDQGKEFLKLCRIRASGIHGTAQSRWD